MAKGFIRMAAAAFVAGIAVQAQAQPARATPPSREGALFEYLMAEVASQRGETGPAVATLLRLAREYRDPQIARRAVELAIRARALEPALESAMLLVELEPEPSLGRDLVASLVANRGDLDKAAQTLDELIAASGNPPLALGQLAYFFGRFPDKPAVLAATQRIAAKYPQHAEARYAVGVAALLAGDTALARTQAAGALEMRPGWGSAAILNAQVLKKVEPAQVVPYYQDFAKAHPGAKEVRLQLARELAAARRHAEALAEFRALEQLSPADPQLPYAVGLLALQMDLPEEADAALKRALALNHPEPGTVHLALGQAAEARKRPDEALDWYGRVDSADRMRAQMRIATIIAKRDGLDKGRATLKAIEPRTQEDRIQVIQIEAQLLRDAKAWRDTFDMLSKAVESFPESFELLYDRAMAAERVDRIDVLESDLRRVIQLKPDYAHAYNALGYTLADRSERLEEAQGLIEKALKISPDDPFILDSLGWVHYRRGNLDDAVRHLRAAYGARPDPEIAAHLGEVLWKRGEREEARRVWQAALSQNPDHETLIAVIQRFQP